MSREREKTMSADINAIYNGELTTYEQRAKLRRERREKQRSASVSCPVYALVSSRVSYMSVTRYKIAFCIVILNSSRAMRMSEVVSNDFLICCLRLRPLSARKRSSRVNLLYTLLTLVS